MSRTLMVAFQVLVAAALVMISATVGDVWAVVVACLGMLWLAVEQRRHEARHEAVEPSMFERIEAQKAVNAYRAALLDFKYRDTDESIRPHP